MKRANLTTITFVFLVLAYMSIRHFIYATLPKGDDFANWLARDTIMVVPRLFFGGIALFYGLRKFGKVQMGFTTAGARICLILFLMDVLILIVDGSIREPYHLPSSQIILLSFSSLTVGFNEEILFRGVGLSALKSWKSETHALWISSLIFMLFHFGAQPFSEWPGIFFFGLLMAQMRFLGVSLYWLILYHAAFDSLWYVLDGTGGPSSRWVIYGLLSAILPMSLFLLRKLSWLYAQ